MKRRTLSQRSKIHKNMDPPPKTPPLIEASKNGTKNAKNDPKNDLKVRKRLRHFKAPLCLKYLTGTSPKGLHCPKLA